MLNTRFRPEVLLNPNSFLKKHILLHQGCSNLFMIRSPPKCHVFGPPSQNISFQGPEKERFELQMFTLKHIDSKICTDVHDFSKIADLQGGQ